MLVAPSEAWLEECVSSIKKKETEIRECYSEPVDLNSREFVEMMIIDGLFIIGMLMRSDLRKSYVAVADDPFDGNDWLLFMVEQDMLLLENQIPLFVLQCLYKIIFNAERVDSLNEVIHKFITKMWQRMLPTHETIPFEAHPDQCEHAEHLLDCLVVLIKPPAYTDSAGCKSSSSWKIVQILKKLNDNMPKRIRLSDEERVNHSDEYCDYFLPSATELRRAGVSIGILEIPPVLISDDTDPLLRNIIACEQLYGVCYHMTSYVNFMDFLINSADDVKLLRRRGIISNYLGCDEDVSDMFNKLCVGIVVEGSTGGCYSRHIRDINKFYQKRRHFWKATLQREYFSNPWAIISLFAAVLLIALTIISTVFTILSVIIPKS
ncbi:hypothetical protein MKW92_013185 [Papaver armeniacum]|nr:hypothetical protein MKW92_013185 [Papaver armeniacum]